jgi:short-subunit dehydrogenase
MSVRLKKLRDQVIVLTGASSGIGLATARLAAVRGARLVLAARSGEELQQLADEINRAGGRAVPVVADVSRDEEVCRIVDAARYHFGGFDTWVNNAGVIIFGRLEDTPAEDFRRLFDTNFWGVVHGSLAAVRHLRQWGGALVNVGSLASDRAFPLQGMYAASKHAVKGFTDALRTELEHDRAPVSVTLVKPTAMSTALPRHGANYLGEEPTLPPPVYETRLAAEAILHAAEHPARDLYVGDAARVMASMAAVAPKLTDRLMAGPLFDAQKSGRPPEHARRGNLDRPTHDLSERGAYGSPVVHTSVSDAARDHPVRVGLEAAGLGLAGWALWKWVARDGASPAAARESVRS